MASIPTFFEKNAFNAVESYAKNPGRTIKTTFTYHKGSFDGPVKTMTPTGVIRDSSNAVWGMRLLWPLTSEYLIAYLNADYSQTIIARNAVRALFAFTSDQVFSLATCLLRSHAQSFDLVNDVVMFVWSHAHLRQTLLGFAIFRATTHNEISFHTGLSIDSEIHETVA